MVGCFVESASVRTTFRNSEEYQKFFKGVWQRSCDASRSFGKWEGTILQGWLNPKIHACLSNTCDEGDFPEDDEQSDVFSTRAEAGDPDDGGNLEQGSDTNESDYKDMSGAEEERNSRDTSGAEKKSYAKGMSSAEEESESRDISDAKDIDGAEESDLEGRSDAEDNVACQGENDDQIETSLAILCRRWLGNSAWYGA